MRKEIFLANKVMVERFNELEAEKKGYKIGLNHLSDLTLDEKNLMLGYKKIGDDDDGKNTPEAIKFLDEILKKDVPVPDELDWRKEEGRVTQVRNQGLCGSCWAFSATGGLEGQMKVRDANLTLLSVQNLVDCSYSNLACNGGLIHRAFNDVAKEGGIQDARSYLYDGMQGSCRFDKKKVVFNDKGFAKLKEGDESLLKTVVAKFGPVPVAIDASHDGFIHYAGGVYYYEYCSEIIDHAVLVVGYGTDEKEGDYWIVKNSWTEE